MAIETIEPTWPIKSRQLPFGDSAALLAPVAALPSELTAALLNSESLSKKARSSPQQQTTLPIVEDHAFAFVARSREVYLYRTQTGTAPAGVHDPRPLYAVRFEVGPTNDWLNDAMSLNRLVVCAYSDVFIAAHVAEDPERLRDGVRGQAFMKTLLLGVIGSYAVG